MQVHEACMDHHHKSEFVVEDSLKVESLAGEFRLSGHIACRGRIVIKVEKYIEVLDDKADPLVQTRSYSYNAFVEGYGSFLRHDNAHAHPEHPDAHHYHEYNWRTEEPLSRPVWCGEEGWPNLSEFIRKVEEWYWQHRDELDDPDGAAEDLSVYDARLIQFG